MNERITRALTRLFERHRIVFWYDAKKELREDFTSLSLPGVGKVEITNNEYTLKHRILRREPEGMFLLYKEGPQPEDLDNWLLDVQLAQGDFRTDQTAIWLAELELGMEFIDLVQEHQEFFNSAKRMSELKKLLQPEDTATSIRLKMMSICASAEPRLDSILEHLLHELAEGGDEKMRLTERCALEGALWKQLERHYAYHSESPGIRDFLYELFKSSWAMGTDGEIKLNGDALVFLKRWKDSRQFEASFEELSSEVSRVLNIETDIAARDIRDLIDIDYFRLIDQKIIAEMVRAVVNRTESPGDIALWIRRRRQSHWYDQFSHLYEALDYASRFLRLQGELTLTMASAAEGIDRYTRGWYQLDQFYRKFTYHARCAGQASLMEPLVGEMENRYSNGFLLPLGDQFQRFLDDPGQWKAIPQVRQSNFYKTFVAPFLKRDNKVFVVISDALRYEIGEELLSKIRREDRYGADLEAALASLPSYTQLGMAALLPNQELGMSARDTVTVTVDGQSSLGSPNRQKILQAGIPGKNGTVIGAEEFLKMPREGDDGYRSLFSGNDVVYIYHNRIDMAGDKRESEEQVFEAAEKALEDLVAIVKKLSAANATNMVITADHGFLYQHRPLDESDYAGEEAEGEIIYLKNRRFVIGRGLKKKSGLHWFSSGDLGLSGDVEIQIPRSINRLRVKGAGSRFVHGGASLQELIIPVLKINKKRQSDTTLVEVDILRGAGSLITSGQLAVSFYQSRPVSEKVQNRTLRAGIYTDKGVLISDSHELSFDFTSENPRERELQVQFILTREADKANNQEVFLKLEEKHAGTSHYREYKSLRYTIRRTFTSDFDIL